ncbi:cold shock domain-containing protein [Candidatus Woesearchaeota archaeon]|jgi:cold shock protein|nr:cold shock domain-containing protein [Candidatus Woesearchaeota archaeon]MBT4387438.1 cold shock domain-containing protein [Candidatus Woesearchaeota archaeon]MBT4595815.1 cold shock domain-containing protein [Candidatus Woesearchaeota archaeon]MBT5741336.1 cold shock domain-containing protein [Candidatus Woesearchaeota archaeon]MBT6505578.1 cold shock domain-containing protein [Candidatus Woesearchaeota archaeon]
MEGTVKFFNERKGFGFIKTEDGKEYFVHQSALQEGMVLSDNDVVQFDIEDGERGPKAVNVQKSESSNEDNTEE